AMSALSSASSSSCCSLRSLAMLLLLILQLSDASLQFLELLSAALHSDLLSLVQTMLQVFDGLLHVFLHALQMCIIIAVLAIVQLELSVTLHLLLHSKGLISAPGLRFQRRLKRIEHPLVVPFGLLHFLIFLSHFALHVSLHLVEL
uniref:Uncharacterized protein n=1 Tax=Acanthochromis polyacanthus TaxID=80966 RepID=A0A3Q1FWF4_9TELE